MFSPEASGLQEVLRVERVQVGPDATYPIDKNNAFDPLGRSWATLVNSWPTSTSRIRPRPRSGPLLGRRDHF